MREKKFVDGLIVKPPHERAPDFVKGSISIKRKELGNWLRNESDDWINIDVKESQGGKYYGEVNTWKPENKPAEHHSGAVDQKNPTYGTDEPWRGNDMEDLHF